MLRIGFNFSPPLLIRGGNKGLSNLFPQRQLFMVIQKWNNAILQFLLFLLIVESGQGPTPNPLVHLQLVILEHVQEVNDFALTLGLVLFSEHSFESLEHLFLNEFLDTSEFLVALVLQSFGKESYVAV